MPRIFIGFPEECQAPGRGHASQQAQTESRSISRLECSGSRLTATRFRFQAILLPQPPEREKCHLPQDPVQTLFPE
ncbi:hypothetical protein AAY473_008078 [Plecturocebus cupreus]